MAAEPDEAGDAETALPEGGGSAEEERAGKCARVRPVFSYKIDERGPRGEGGVDLFSSLGWRRIDLACVILRLGYHHPQVGRSASQREREREKGGGEEKQLV